MPATSKNIWALPKQHAIKVILLLLQQRIGAENVLLLDEDKLSDQAVRLVSPHSPRELSVYIYSYAQRAEHYGLDLEFPLLIETQADDQTIRLEDLSASEVLEHVIDHLELTV